MMLSFKNKHAIVCGSTDGIGRSTAQLLASLGCEVTLVARNQKKLERVKAFELVNNECNIIWEPVPFSESYIPSIPTIISTSAIALVAATSPLILNIIKPLIKNLVKKVTNKKKS